MIKLKPLIISVLISSAVGGLAGLLTMNSQDIYSRINTPFFAPPSFLFPIVWIFLYILMGVSAYLIYTSHTSPESKQAALTIYAISLIVNFIWPIIFFNTNAYTFSFIWILLLCLLVALTIFVYYKINKLAAYLQIPYFIWIIFAAILNLFIAIMN